MAASGWDNLDKDLAAHKQREAEKEQRICNLERRIEQLEREVRRNRPTRVPGNPDWERY